MFADIAGFTKYAASVKAENVVNMLRILFNEFDVHCRKRNLYKVYTIGDCYVVIGTKNANSRLPIHEEARNSQTLFFTPLYFRITFFLFAVTQFAFDMIDIIKKVRAAIQFEDLDMRIGIHTVISAA